MVKVKVETFKDTGKLYLVYEYESQLPVWDRDNLVKEAKGQCSDIRTSSFVLEVKDGDALGKWLILKEISEQEIKDAALVDYQRQTKYANGYDRQKGFIEGVKWHKLNGR